MNNQKILISFIVILFFVIGCLSIVLFCVTLGYFEEKTKNNFQEMNFEYIYRSYYPDTEETTVGFVNLHNELKEDEFVTYDRDDGSIVLISPFSLDGYRCEGFCRCSEADSQERRSSVKSFPTTSKVVTYLLAAFSTFSAHKLAREYFDEVCKEDELLICEDSSSQVFSEVDHCVMMDSKEEISQQDSVSSKEEENDKNNVEEPPPQKLEFLCKGNCVPLDVFIGIDSMEREGREKESMSKDDAHVIHLMKLNIGSVRRQIYNFGCEKIMYEKIVKVDVPAHYGGSKDEWILFAEKDFLLQLNTYCYFTPKMKVFLENKSSGKTEEMEIGGVCGGDSDEHPNKSIKCVFND